MGEKNALLAVELLSSLLLRGIILLASPDISVDDPLLLLLLLLACPPPLSMMLQYKYHDGGCRKVSERNDRVIGFWRDLWISFFLFKQEKHCKFFSQSKATTKSSDSKLFRLHLYM